MNPAQRVVTHMPLSDLWSQTGPLKAHRLKSVGREEITQLLRDGSTFVVADVGHPLRWIPEQDRFTFWKSEVEGHLVPAEVNGFCPEAYPGEYCYVASKWHAIGSKPIVVLEKHH